MSLPRGLENLPKDVLADFERMTAEERELFIAAITDPEVLPILYSVDYREIPVSPDVFFSEPYYFGHHMVWDPVERRGLFPKWKDELCKVLDPKNQIYEFILSGAIGTGKTTVAMAAVMYQIYWLTCLRDPHAYLGMLPSSPIEIFLFSITLATVADAGISRFERMLGGSPYFRDKFPPNRRRRVRGGKRGNDFDYKLELPPFLEIVEGSRETHFISRDILGGILDEANFVPQPKGSGSLNYDSTSRVFSLYQSLRNRIESRFMKQGQMFGIMCLISSAATRFDFLEQHKRRQRDNPHVHISEFPIYEVKPWDYSGRRFRVLLGTEQTNSRIMRDGEAVPTDTAHQVIDIPVEHRDAFERDISRALRDVAGVPSEVISPFIQRDYIGRSVDHSRPHPFTVESPVISHLSTTQLEEFVIAQQLVRWEGNILVPKHHRSFARHIHIDLSKTQCATGFTMGCVAGYVEVKRPGPDGRDITSRSPIVWIDFTLQIMPPESPGEIDYSKVRYFIKYLRDSLHFTIGTVTFDGYNSTDSRQILLKEGFLDVEILSVDKTPGPYLGLRSALMEGRILRPPYTPLDQELATLRLIQEGNKVWVERGIGELKDVSDSLAGVVHACNEEAAMETSSIQTVQQMVVTPVRQTPLVPLLR